MASLSFTDLPKSFLNPFLFPGSILLGMMNDFSLEPPGLLEICSFRDVFGFEVSKMAGGFAVPYSCRDLGSRLGCAFFSSFSIVSPFFILSFIFFICTSRHLDELFLNC